MTEPLRIDRELDFCKPADVEALVNIASNQHYDFQMSFDDVKKGINFLAGFFPRAQWLKLSPYVGDNLIIPTGIAVGMMGTPVGSKDHTDRQRTYENSGIPAGHIGSPSDVASFVSFLVSEKAQYIYGAILSVDGGLTAGCFHFGYTIHRHDKTPQDSFPV